MKTPVTHLTHWLNLLQLVATRSLGQEAEANG